MKTEKSQATDELLREKTLTEVTKFLNFTFISVLISITE